MCTVTTKYKLILWRVEAVIPVNLFQTPLVFFSKVTHNSEKCLPSSFSVSINLSDVTFWKKEVLEYCTNQE